MSDKKQIMVRLDPSDYERLRRFAYQNRIPVAVMARNAIVQQLGLHDVPADELLAADQDETPPETPPKTPRPSSSGRRSPNAKRRKKKNRR